MADSSFLSDSDDEKAVNEILAQAMDQSVLEQVAAINCSGFTDSVLPTHLETRFHKLKSFPATKPTSLCRTITHKNPSASSSFKSQLPSVESEKPSLENESKPSVGATSESDSHSDDENVVFSSSKEKPVKKKGLKPTSRSGVATSTSKSPEFSVEDGILSPSKKKTDVRVGVKSESQSGSFLSPSNSWDSTIEPLSPPRKTGCFWCSPKKKDSRKKSKENMISGLGIGLGWEKNWEMNDAIFSDLSTFSTKEQQKMLKKAMKEEEKITREAEKIVKWAKQRSARMDVSGINDELSDSESTK